MKKSTQAEIFEALLTPHINDLYKTAFRLSGTREAAEDLVQDVLVKLYPKTAEIQKLDMPGPWLKKVLYRHFIDELRKRSRRPESRLSFAETDMDSMKSPGNNPEMLAEAAEIKEKLQAAFNTLTEWDRLVVTMHLVEGYTLQEMAEIYNMPPETLKTQIRRAKVKLKKYLKI